MLPVFNKSLIFVLAMLQLFAPLVHAHTGNNSFSRGIHVPGLESYRNYHDASVAQNVNVDRDSEGLLVMVDAGIKNPHDMSVESSDGHFALIPISQCQVKSLPESDHNFSPQRQSSYSSTHLTAHSPRAPPAQ